MSATDDSLHLAGSRRSSSTTCKPLLDAARPGLFRSNAFRIIGLPVDATMREIAKHADKLKTMEELGHGKTAHTFAFALTPLPTVDQIRDAIQKLKDPEQRLVDEFFWFWPGQFGKSAHDPAIQALAAGDRETALEIWTLKETSPTEGTTAMHNVAVLWHLVALEWEEYAGQDEVDDERRRKIERYWRDAFKRWEHLTTDDVFWETVSQRVKQLDDARLSTGFVRRMRAALPQALNKINAELAISHAEHGRMELARLHVQFMRETNQGLNDVEKTAELVLAPATTRLKQQIRRAQDRSRSNPADAGQAVTELLKHAKSSVGHFDLIAGPSNESRNDLFDEVAQVSSALLVTYRQRTNDAALCLTNGPDLLRFATSGELRRQIEENLSAWRQMVSSTMLEPVYAILKALQDSGEHPKSCLTRFRRDAVPAISAFPASAVGVEAHAEMCDSAAIVLRAISLAAWNKHEDKATAIGANQLAATYAHGAEIKARLIEDWTALNDIFNKVGDAAGESQRIKRGSYDSMIYVIIAFVLQIVWAGAAFAGLVRNVLGMPLAEEAGLTIGCAAGLTFALLVFWDRWKCVEAFSSRFCSGAINASIFYVPLVALVYANWRGLKKMFQGNQEIAVRRWPLLAMTVAILIGAVGSYSSKDTSGRIPSTASATPTPSRYTAPSSIYTAPAPTYTTSLPAFATPLPTYTAPSTYTAPPNYTAPPSNGTIGKDTYRVPSYISSELDKDKRAIESEKTKAAALENRLGIAKQTVESEKAKAEELDGQSENLKAQVDRARIYLDQTSQAAVDDFNRKVNRSNAMLGNMRTQSASVNHAVDTHNALLEQVRSQNRVVNQMVDDYNAKLRRSGR